MFPRVLQKMLWGTYAQTEPLITMRYCECHNFTFAHMMFRIQYGKILLTIKKKKANKTTHGSWKCRDVHRRLLSRKTCVLDGKTANSSHGI